MAALQPLLDFNKLRADAIELVKRAGRKVPSTLLRTVNATPTDPTKPWRVGTGSILQFKFTGVVSYIGFPRNSDPKDDGNIEVIIPGDLAETGSVSDPNTLCGDPTLVDRLDIDGVQYSIMGIQPVKPYDKAIIYKVRAKPWPSIFSLP